MFLPVIVDMPSPQNSEKGYYCPLLQANKYMVQMALDLDVDRIISPIVHFKYDCSTLALELGDQISSKLGRSKSDIKKALNYALDRQNNFINDMFQTGQKVIEDHDPKKPLVIVTGRPYNLYDERLNLRLGENLSKTGVTALPMDFLNVNSVDLSDFPDMYWGLGAAILRTAKLIKSYNNYFGIHITNFSCGADSFLEHFYKYIMGNKPYLVLELDEHSAVAGVMTRIEAFKNVIENSLRKSIKMISDELKLSN